MGEQNLIERINYLSYFLFHLNKEITINNHSSKYGYEII